MNPKFGGKGNGKRANYLQQLQMVFFDFFVSGYSMFIWLLLPRSVHGSVFHGNCKSAYIFL
jgi:hypothetical protein